MINMKLSAFVFQFVFLLSLVFVSRVHASQNLFELVSPSSYRPVNLLTEYKTIDSGHYRLNLRQDIQGYFPGKKLVAAEVYLVLPNTCRIDEITSGYKVLHRTDFSYYVFAVPASDNRVQLDISMALKLASIRADVFGFLVIARDDQGNILIHNHHDDAMHKAIIMQEYPSNLPD